MALPSTQSKIQPDLGEIMGYTTAFRGEIRIEPPIPWGDIKDSPFRPENAKGRNGQDRRRDVMFRIAETERDTQEGRLIVRQAVALLSTWEDEARGYDILKHVQEAVDAYPAHEFLDRIDCEGEENDDMWRLKVVNRVATKFEPEIVWPPESE